MTQRKPLLFRLSVISEVIVVTTAVYCAYVAAKDHEINRSQYLEAEKQRQDNDRARLLREAEFETARLQVEEQERAIQFEAERARQAEEERVRRQAEEERKRLAAEEETRIAQAEAQRRRALEARRRAAQAPDPVRFVQRFVRSLTTPKAR